MTIKKKGFTLIELAFVLFQDQTDPPPTLACGSDRLELLRRRPVVDHHDLVERDGLRQGALDRLADEPPVIEVVDETGRRQPSGPDGSERGRCWRIE